MASSTSRAAVSGSRPAIATALLSAAGVVLSGMILSVHRQMAATPEYASWCNVSERVNCDVVLSSSYAYFLGLPLGFWGLLTYLGCAAGAVFVLRTGSASQRRQAAILLFLVALWCVAFSVYLGWVSLAVLDSLCMMCSGLYLVNAGLLASTSFLLGSLAPRRGRSLATAGGDRRSWVVAALVGTAVLGFLAVTIWKLTRPEPMTAAEIARADPEFYEWYRSLPVVTEEIPLRAGEGPAGAVRVVEFSDFECGHCARASQNLKRVLPRFQGRVTVSFRHFPLDQACNSSVSGSFHRYACLAATAAECAALQGEFWEYHDVLFQNQGGLDRASLLRYAGAVGLDVASFETCLSGDAPREAVRNDVQLGVRLGISSTPTLFLNGRAVRGALEPEKLTYALRLEQEWARQAPR